MKKKVLALCMICLFGFGCAATSTTGGVSVYRETNRFTGETTIYSTKSRISLLRAKALFFSYSWTPSEMETQTLPPPYVRGTHQEWGHSRWKYLEYHDLIFLADGESIAIPRTTHDGTVGSGAKLYEYVYFSVDWADFLKLCEATKVEYKLGAYEHKIKSKTQTEMRALRDELFR